MNFFNTAFVAAAVMFGVSTFCHAQQPLVEPYLLSGKLSAGQLELEKHLTANPDDDQARFGLGVLRFMQSVEHLAQEPFPKGLRGSIYDIRSLVQLVERKSR